MTNERDAPVPIDDLASVVARYTFLIERGEDAALDRVNVWLNKVKPIDDTEPHITDAGRCSACGAEIDIELIAHYDYQIDRGGVQPGTVHGPAVYWNEGTIACPGCGARLPYAESSD